jgi:hypothetical protein
MSVIRTGVTESRPLDAMYDSSFVGPYTQSFTDKRVLSKLSSSNMVAGKSRFKYFRRPVMPVVSSASPQVLLAPTNEDPLVPIEEETEPQVKTVEVQTMYRDSEAQTNPYTPAYTIPEGQDPEILLLRELTYEHGLPVGPKEMEMVEQARMKRNLEANVPPFTDEASLALRRNLMEQQELKEFRFRENEIDAKREEKLSILRQALLDRDESNEFLSAQRVEAVRQSKMDEREKQLEKIRAKRIKALRRLANERNKADPILHENASKNIIDDHFEKSSALYAPKKRDGNECHVNHEQYNILSRTAPYEDMNKLVDLEASIPRRLLSTDEYLLRSPLTTQEKHPLLSQSGPILKDRLTSAARRDLKNTKRDVDEMHRIIQHRKRVMHNQTTHQVVAAATETLKASETSMMGSDESRLATLSRRAKGRPMTPDLTVDENGEPKKDDREFQAAVILLQSIIRGRAVQNVMVEGLYRHRELITELRQADEHIAREAAELDEAVISAQVKEKRDRELRETTESAVIGGVTSNLLVTLAAEKVRRILLPLAEDQLTCFLF